MSTGGRLALFGAGLLAAFAAAFGVAATAVPGDVVAAWEKGSEMNEHESKQHGDHGQLAVPGTAEAPLGLALSAGGYTLSPIEAPRAAGEVGELRFHILGDGGDVVTAYAAEHGKQLHLIVVRNDGREYRHAHPELDERTGAWSLPWSWDEAGTYRVYADFTAEGAAGVTLSRTVEVAGEYTPTAPQPRRVDEVDGYRVAMHGDLAAGAIAPLTLSITRDGEPVSALEPYLGAFGHLVVLRQGDLAYLHVHPHGEEPSAGETGGPEVAFAAQAPTAGRYLLYFDFQVGGEVRTARFVLDAGASADAGAHGDADAHAHRGTGRGEQRR